MKKQYSALIEGDETKYVKDSNGNMTFSSLDELEHIIMNNSSITGAKIYEREVTDWTLKSELFKEK